MVFPGVMYGCENWTIKKLITQEWMLLNYGVGKDSWESLGLQGDPTNQSSRKSVLSIHWKDWCWSWNSNTLTTWCEELTPWKRPWYWERLKTGGEGDNRGWDGWVASPTRWTSVWADSDSWWWSGRPGVLQFMESQRVRHDWVTKWNWSPTYSDIQFPFSISSLAMISLSSGIFILRSFLLFYSFIFL